MRLRRLWIWRPRCGGAGQKCTSPQGLRRILRWGHWSSHLRGRCCDENNNLQTIKHCTAHTMYSMLTIVSLQTIRSMHHALDLTHHTATPRYCMIGISPPHDTSRFFCISISSGREAEREIGLRNHTHEKAAREKHARFWRQTRRIWKGMRDEIHAEMGLPEPAGGMDAYE